MNFPHDRYRLFLVTRARIESKDDWSIENARSIAEAMNVECDQLFTVFLVVFLDEVVRCANFDQFLIPLAINYYKKFISKNSV